MDTKFKEAIEQDKKFFTEMREFYTDFNRLKEAFHGEFGDHYNDKHSFRDDLWEYMLIELQGAEPEEDDTDFPDYCKWDSFAAKYIERWGNEKYKKMMDHHITESINWIQILTELKHDLIEPLGGVVPYETTPGGVGVDDDEE